MSDPMTPERTEPVNLPASASPELPPVAEPARRDWLALAIPILLSAMVVLMALAPLGYVLMRNLPRPVATIDLQKLVLEAQQRHLARTNRGAVATAGISASDAAAEQAAATVDSARFARDLSVAVEQLGRTCRCVLVNKAAVLNGSTLVDYTDALRTRLNLATKESAN